LASEELRELVRREVRKALMEFTIELLPYVSDEEQEEIDEIAGKPEDYGEDFVEWSGS